MKKFWRGKALMFIAFAMLYLVSLPFLVMLLWNAILPALFHVGHISFLQSAGLILLVRMLSGGFRRRRRFAGHCGNRNDYTRYCHVTVNG